MTRGCLVDLDPSALVAARYASSSLCDLANPFPKALASSRSLEEANAIAEGRGYAT